MTADAPHPASRRHFFRDALHRVAAPLGRYLEQRFNLHAHEGQVYLRPPGALEERRFVTTCDSCARCVEACPANAIFLLGDAAGPARGTPVIDADRAACVVCDGLLCTHACPSGALLPLNEPRQIRMGTAEVYGGLCVRSRGEHCTTCVELCPLGDAAIRFNDEGPPEVLADGCTGCGVCQLYCPTRPKAIVVQPAGPATNAAIV